MNFRLKRVKPHMTNYLRFMKHYSENQGRFSLVFRFHPRFLAQNVRKVSPESFWLID